MRGHKLSTVSVAVLNLKHSLTRTVGLVLLMAALSGVFFLGNVFLNGLQKGMDNLKDRMGADIMVVPVENDTDMEAILLKGEPSCFYFSKNLYAKIGDIGGIKQYTSQFFLTSLDAECCDTRVQLIGFDPETDFCVTPWISEVYKEKLEDGAVIIGSDVNADESGTIKLFDTHFKVAAKLDATGTGLDKAVYGTDETIKFMYEAAYKKGQRFLDEADPDSYISSILIKVDDEADQKTVVKNLRKALGGVKVAESQSMIKNTAESIKRISGLMYLFEGLFFIVTIITVYLVFYITLNERKKEIAILRTIGVTGKKLTAILQTEAALVAVIGAFAGILAVLVFVFPFHVFIIDRIAMPYILPTVFRSIVTAVLTLALSAAVSCISSFLTIRKICRTDVYATMREGE